MINLAEFAPDRPIPTAKLSHVVLRHRNFVAQMRQSVHLARPRERQQGKFHQPRLLRTAKSIENSWDRMDRGTNRYAKLVQIPNGTPADETIPPPEVAAEMKMRQGDFLFR